MAADSFPVNILTEWPNNSFRSDIRLVETCPETSGWFLLFQQTDIFNLKHEQQIKDRLSLL